MQREPHYSPISFPNWFLLNPNKHLQTLLNAIISKSYLAFSNKIDLNITSIGHIMCHLSVTQTHFPFISFFKHVSNSYFNIHDCFIYKIISLKLSFKTHYIYKPFSKHTLYSEVLDLFMV